MGASRDFNLADLLIHRPGPIGDPPPWLLNVLKQEQVVELGHIVSNYQKAVNTAHNAALDQMQALLKRGGK